MRVMTSAMERWAAYRRWHWASETLGVSLDLSKMMVDGALVARLEPRFAAAFSAMAALEKGAIGNPDENRRSGVDHPGDGADRGHRLVAAGVDGPREITLHVLAAG